MFSRVAFVHCNLPVVAQDFRLVFDFFRFHPLNTAGASAKPRLMAHAQPFATHHTYHFLPLPSGFELCLVVVLGVC